jgi:glycosyltransferase involved in cell wall biosynthesis
MMAGAVGKTILFLVTEDWYFCSHRLPIARAARDAGATVIVATRVDSHGPEIEREGFRLEPLPWRRRSTDPWREARAFASIVRLYRRHRPDIVHHVALKPAVYGGLAARLARVPVQINAIAGLGFTGVSRSHRARVLRPVLRALLRGAWGGSGVHAIVQNPDDADVLVAARLIDRRNVHLVRGSGVDVSRFRPLPEPDGRTVAAYVGRFIDSKGIRELVDAARLLCARGVDLEVRLVGEPDPENPESIPEDALRAWEAEGSIVRQPWTTDVVSVWTAAHIAVLPSYREGLPKALLEASACARPVVACDVPGCREVVVPGETGLLVPARDAGALADALARLAADAALRRRMGENGRARVEAHFSERRVVDETLDLYRRAGGWSPA